MTDLGLDGSAIEGPTDPSAESISARAALKQYSQRILEQVKEKLKGEGLSNAQIIDLLDVYRNAKAAETITPRTEIKVKISDDVHVTSKAEQSIADGSKVYENFVKQYFKPQTEAIAVDAASESPQSKYDLAACLAAYKKYKEKPDDKFPKLSFAEFFFIANNHQKLDEGCFVSSQFRWAHNVANFFNNKVTVKINGEEQTLIDFYTSAAPASKERMDFLDSKGVKTCTTLMEPSATTKFFGALAVPALRLEWAMIKKLKKFAATKEGLKVIVAPAKFQLEDLVGVGKSSIAKMVNQYAKEAKDGGYALSCKSGKDRTGIIAAMISATAVAMWQDSTIKGQVTGKSGDGLKQAFLAEMQKLDLDKKLQEPEFYKNFVKAFLKQIPARNFIANANTVGCAGLQIGKMYQIQYLINKGKKLASKDENLTAMIRLLKNYNKQQVASGSLTKLNKFKGLVKKAGKIKRAVQQVVQKVKKAVSRGR